MNSADVSTNAKACIEYWEGGKLGRVSDSQTIGLLLLNSVEDAYLQKLQQQDECSKKVLKNEMKMKAVRGLTIQIYDLLQLPMTNESENGKGVYCKALKTGKQE